jgi:5-methylcytosine-specific restriction endonuclease McrA
MTMQTLLLTPWMSPHKVISWQSAVVMSYLGKVDVLAEYDETIRSPSTSVRAPAVVRLKRPLAGQKRGVKFSRMNVFARDGFRCMYCGARGGVKELTYDHVVPRAQGGRTTWENIVASCYACNHAKRGRTPEQAGMPLLRAPSRPRSLPMAAAPLRAGDVPAAWASYWRA